jgi:HK97 gp10 family phage protein
MGDDWGDVRIEGLTELHKTLNALPVHLEKKAVMGALRAAAQIIRKEAQENVPVLQKPDPRRKPGTVKRNITVKRSKRERAGVYIGVAKVGRKALANFKKSGGRKGANNPDDPFYWMFLEFGTKNYPAQRFLRNAFESKRFAAIAKFREYMARRLKKEAEKLARSMGSRAA